MRGTWRKKTNIGPNLAVSSSLPYERSPVTSARRPLVLADAQMPCSRWRSMDNGTAARRLSLLASAGGPWAPFSPWYFFFSANTKSTQRVVANSTYLTWLVGDEETRTTRLRLAQPAVLRVTFNIESY